MQITCGNCKRQFDLDEALLAGAKAAVCECGNRLNLGRPGEAPSHLGKYALVHLIAKGGMGEIYYGRVSGVEGFAREVAIKRMLPHLVADAEFSRSMVQEAKLTNLLNHPNIVQVYDLAREGSELYIAMEYVPGITLSSLLEQLRAAKARVPVELAVHIARNLLRGLNYAHHFQLPDGSYKSIVHRDITPQNIMLTQRGFVKITDFGIAKAVGEISTTSPGLIKGKIGYLAPEQLMGHLPDHRVDLFCAAIVLWEMLALKRLFKGVTEVDTFNLIAQTQIPDLNTFRDDVPVALMDVLKKALARNPEDRYPTADDFVLAISHSIAPKTADDFSHTAEVYLKEHSELFTQIYQPQSSDAQSSESLTQVTAYTRRTQLPKAEPKASGSAPYVIALAAVVLLVALGSAAYVLLRPQPPQPIAQAPVSAPAPIPAPAPQAAPVAVPPAAAPASAPVASAPTEPQANKNGESKRDEAEKEESHRTKRRAHKSEQKQEAAAPLTGAEIQAVVLKNQRAVLHCLKSLDTKKAPDTVAAHITIAESGKVSEVRFEPELMPDAKKCLTDAMEAMRFRKHPIDGLEVTIPLKIKVF